MKKRALLSLLFMFTVQAFAPSFAVEDSFNLAGIIENIINYQNNSDFVSDIRNDSKENYLYAVQNLTNGNVVVAYNEFNNTINSLDKNISLLMLSKKLYEYGFFSLGDAAVSKISGKNKMTSQIEQLKEAYRPSYNLSKEEENFLVKAYSSIYFNNSPEEVAFNLIKKTILMENSDYANFIMAQAMFQCRQYNQALIYVNKALDKNPKCAQYLYFKAKTLCQLNQYKEALKFVETLEKNNLISIYFAVDFNILKQQINMNLAKNDSDKKFYQIYCYYLTGNYYKTLKETNNILNFNKNNPKILTLQAMAHLALGQYKEAYDDFLSGYKMDKKFDLTLMGLADCNFINKQYEEAYKGYKKLFNTEFKNEAKLKAYITLNEMNEDEKKIAKLEKEKETIDKKAFIEYYIIANNLFNDNPRNKKRYTAKSLSINMLNVNTWDILLDVSYKNKDFKNLDTLVFMLSFLDVKNPEYYYYSALSMNEKNNKKDAFFEVKKALNLNPEYKPAIELMNKLQNELIW